MSDNGSPRRGGSDDEERRGGRREDSRERSPVREGERDGSAPRKERTDDTPNNKTIFVSGYDDRDTEADIRKMFEKFGKVDKVDVKNRFSFISMPYLAEAEEAIDRLRSSRLRVEFTRGDGEVKRREEQRKAEAHTKPSTTLFVVNFDPMRVRSRDLEDAFGPYGELARCEIKKNFAFVEYRNLDDAIKAKEGMNGQDVCGRDIVVEYQARSAGGGGGGGGRGYGGGGGGYDRGGYDRGGYDRRRSPPRRDYDRYDRRDSRRSRSRDRYDDRRRDRYDDRDRDRSRDRRRSRSPYR